MGTSLISEVIRLQAFSAQRWMDEAFELQDAKLDFDFFL